MPKSNRLFGGDPGFGNNDGGKMDAATRKGAFPRYDEMQVPGGKAPKTGTPSSPEPTRKATGAPPRSISTGTVSTKVGGKNNTMHIQAKPSGGNSTATKQVPYQERIKGCVD